MMGVVDSYKGFDEILKVEDNKYSLIMKSFLSDIDIKDKKYFVMLDGLLVERGFGELLKGVFRGYDDLVDVDHVKALVRWVEVYAQNLDVFKEGFNKTFVEVLSGLETKNSFIRKLLKEMSVLEKNVVDNKDVLIEEYKLRIDGLNEQVAGLVAELELVKSVSEEKKEFEQKPEEKGIKVVKDESEKKLSVEPVMFQGTTPSQKRERDNISRFDKRIINPDKEMRF